jgi:hypothetical protein
MATKRKPGGGLKARMTTSLYEIIVAKSKDVKTGCYLAEYSKEGYGPKMGSFANDDEDNSERLW